MIKEDGIVMETSLSALLDYKGYTVQSISPTTTVHACATKMSELKVGALIVLVGDKVAGIISERDILRRVVVPGDDPKKLLVEAIMTKDLVTVSPSTTVREAMHIVTDKRIRHLPVLQEGKLVGLISIGDLTRWAMLWQEQQIASLTNYIQSDRG
jgi:CBS domain-containing protein